MRIWRDDSYDSVGIRNCINQLNNFTSVCSILSDTVASCGILLNTYSSKVSKVGPFSSLYPVTPLSSNLMASLMTQHICQVLGSNCSSNLIQVFNNTIRGCVISGKLFNICGPLFSQLKQQENHYYCSCLTSWLSNPEQGANTYEMRRFIISLSFKSTHSLLFQPHHSYRIGIQVNIVIVLVFCNISFKFL